MPSGKRQLYQLAAGGILERACTICDRANKEQIDHDEDQGTADYAATEVRAADDVTAAIQDIAAEFEPYIIKQRRHFHKHRS